MRDIRLIVLHCTATQPTATVESIRNYWKHTLGWQNPGYHYLIAANGRVHLLAPEATIANGVRGHNDTSIHVSYIGGVDASGHPKDTRTPAQKQAQLVLLRDLLSRYPTARVAGHNQLAAKACPSFDVPAWLAANGFPPERCYRPATSSR